MFELTLIQSQIISGLTGMALGIALVLLVRYISKRMAKNRDQWH